ncbi:hypothetical protein GCM10010515_50960 [Streptomyces fructofermentans]|uniref:Uncharacterized protein n=1 Tax=Streptomyces fructofermentans TaxID=152141 RepID=A0A918KU11_9ACTN|nr:hypothetical protein GCM10010515_50960 [Streptomyces fructofermentans]
MISEAETLKADPDTAKDAASAPCAMAMPSAPTASVHGTSITAVRLQCVRPSPGTVVLAPAYPSRMGRPFRGAGAVAGSARATDESKIQKLLTCFTGRVNTPDTMEERRLHDRPTESAEPSNFLYIDPN